MKATKKPITIDFYTWDEICEFGRKANPDSIRNNMAYNFEFEGFPITHENDNCYIVPTLEGNHFFTPADVLIKGVKGELYPCKKEIFEMTYDIASTNPSTPLERMIVEEGELAGRLMLLNNGLNSLGFKEKVGEHQFKLLLAQQSAMDTYRLILRMRIQDLESKKG